MDTAVNLSASPRSDADPNAHGQYFPLSPYQRDVWLASRQFPSSAQYTIYLCNKFSGFIHEKLLADAMVAVASRTEAFRLRFADEE